MNSLRFSCSLWFLYTCGHDLNTVITTIRCISSHRFFYFIFSCRFDALLYKNTITHSDRYFSYYCYKLKVEKGRKVFYRMWHINQNIPSNSFQLFCKLVISKRQWNVLYPCTKLYKYISKKSTNRFALNNMHQIHFTFKCCLYVLLIHYTYFVLGWYYTITCRGGKYMLNWDLFCICYICVPKKYNINKINWI